MPGVIETPTGIIIEFGSRTGSFVALGLFLLLFGFLGWAICHYARQRIPKLPSSLAFLLGIAIWIVPLVLIYRSSMTGFYEAEQYGDRLRLRYLLEKKEITFPLAEVIKLEAVPDSIGRDRWRLLVLQQDGQSYSSATWRREQVQNALIQLGSRLRASPVE